MPRFILLFLLACPFLLYSQLSQQSRDSLHHLSQADHQLMLKLLNISSLRPGPSANADAPNPSNRDEAKVKPYPSLPDPLTFKNGKKVKGQPQWRKRSREIREDFEREMYGRIPKNVPKVNWTILGQQDTLEAGILVTKKELQGIVDNSSFPEITVVIQMNLTTLANSKTPVPVIMEFGWVLPRNFPLPSQAGTPWTQQVLEKGWGYAILVPTSFQADNGAGLRQGIIGLSNRGEPRKADDWGALRAWAWGVSRALDYFEKDKAVDAKRVAIGGLSRYGKAALVAMAFEPRIAIGLIGSSGAGGAKILRRVFGEQVENLASSGEYHWFAPNFLKYAGPLTPSELPVDAHHLIALCAPRPVFVSAGAPGVEGHWVDAKGTFLAAELAGPVYELLGKKPMKKVVYSNDVFGSLDDDIAFRQHEGGHTIGSNWPYFLSFAERYFQKNKTKK